MKACKTVITVFFVLSCAVSRMEQKVTAPGNRINCEKWVKEKTGSTGKLSPGRSIENRPVFFGKESGPYLRLKKMCSANRLFFCFSVNTCPPCMDHTLNLPVREPDFPPLFFI
jgi:hypothetical protein